VVEAIPGSAAVAVSASSRHTTENTRIPSLARGRYICLTLQIKTHRQPNTKASVLIQEAAYCSGFNSFVMVPNFIVPCLVVRFFDINQPTLLKITYVSSSDIV